MKVSMYLFINALKRSIFSGQIPVNLKDNYKRTYLSMSLNCHFFSDQIPVNLKDKVLKVPIYQCLNNVNFHYSHCRYLLIFELPMLTQQEM